MAVLVGLAMVTTACAEMPQEIDDADRASTVTAITPAAAESVFANYTETYNEANAGQDPDLIATVESGTLLETSRFGFEERQVQADVPAEPVTAAPSTIAAAQFDSYPMWSVVTTQPAEGEGASWYLLTRQDASAPWLAGLAVHPGPDAVLPTPIIENGAAVPADNDAAERGQAVLDELVSFGVSGVEPENVDLTHADGMSRLPDHGLQLDDVPGGFGVVDRSCALENPGEIHWLTTRSGAVAMAAISCTQTMQANPGFSVVVEGTGLGLIPGGAEIVESSITQSASFIISAEIDGSAAVVGQRMRPISMTYTESQPTTVPPTL